MGEAVLLLAMLLAQPVASGLDDLDGNRVPDSWFVRSSTTRRFEVLANGAVRFNSSAGSAGQCLLSNGASTPPSWGSCAGGAGGYTGISDEGSGLTSRATLNFTGAGVTCVDNAGATRTDCTIPGGAGAAYATCQEEGTPLTQRSTINFIGAALTAADNGGSSRTDVTLSQSPASASVVGTGRTLTAGNGLTGGGDLTADRTIDVAVTAPITITGDSVALDSTALLDNQARVMVRRNTGGNVGPRRRLNFIEGANIAITPVDAPATEEVNITIAGAYYQIRDEGTLLTDRNALNFTGSGVSCVDNAGSARTDCTIAGGGGGGGSGTTTIDFGAYPGDPVATVAITGQTGILSGSVVQAWIYPADTADHTLDEHRIVDMRITAHSITPGTGFTITAFFVGSGLHDLMKGSAVRTGNYPPAQAERTSGLWSVAWRWQ